MQLVLMLQGVKQPERSSHILTRICDFLPGYMSGRFVLHLLRLAAERLNSARQGITVIRECKRERMQIGETDTTPPALLIFPAHGRQFNLFSPPIQRRNTDARTVDIVDVVFA